MYGTVERYALGVNTQTTNLWKKIEDAVAKPTPAVQASQAPCFEVVYDDPDITKILPVMQYSVLDAGPYITSGVVFMKDPDTGRRNISFIRLMVKGPKKLGFNPKSLHNKAYYNKIALAGKRMEVAIALGPPSEMLAAGLPIFPKELTSLRWLPL